MNEQQKYDTYNHQPKDGWVCFHCGELFTKRGTAYDHFGPRPTSIPACKMKFEEKDWLMDLRKLEEENAKLTALLESKYCLTCNRISGGE